MKLRNLRCAFSEDYTYRYTLWRNWDPHKSIAMFIGLNPSTADDNKDDPTVRRCTNFAKDWGYGGLCMMNIFAFRATDPKVMKAAQNPIGPDNDMWLKKVANRAGVIVAAWGTHGSHNGRDKEVLELLESNTIHCLQLTKHGHPRHPLYIPKNQELIQFSPNNNKNKEIICPQSSKIHLQKKSGEQLIKTTTIKQ